MVYPNQVNQRIFCRRRFSNLGKNAVSTKEVPGIACLAENQEEKNPYSPSWEIIRSARSSATSFLDFRG